MAALTSCPQGLRRFCTRDHKHVVGTIIALAFRCEEINLWPACLRCENVHALLLGACGHEPLDVLCEQHELV